VTITRVRFFRGDSEFTVALLMPVAWHIGRLAGYL